MKTLALILPLYAVICAAPALSFAADAAHKEESISAKNFRAVQAALPELERWKLNLDDYRITVLEFPDSPSSLSVLFHDPDIPLGTMYGSPGKRPDFAVEINKDDLRVIKSHFVR